MPNRVSAPPARELLATNLRLLRAQRGWSQEKLADEAGFHRTYVSQVERHVTNATLANVERFAEVLGVPVARLFQTCAGASGGSER